MRFLSYVGVLLLGVLQGCSDADQDITGPIGATAYKVEDPSRPNWLDGGARPIRAIIWYKAEDGAKSEEIAIPEDGPVFIAGHAAWDAKPALQTKQPLIILSHGTGGAALQLMWLGARLADAGYVVAALNHHGNTAAEGRYDPRGFRFIWERPRDVSVLLDALLADPEYSKMIDAERIGAAGFSLGSYTVTALAGGRVDLEQFEAFCRSPRRDATCDPQLEYPEVESDLKALLEQQPGLNNEFQKSSLNYKDNRIQAVFAIAPALGSAFTIESLTDVSVPYMAVVGDKDIVAPAATNAAVIAAHIPNATLQVINGGTGHYTFLSTCTLKGRWFVPVCKDEDGVERAEVHRQVAALAQGFFDENLRR